MTENMETHLTLEELTPYLPFKLKGLEVRKSSFRNGEDTKEVFVWKTNDILCFFNKRYGVRSCKPILRPLSDLTKKIWHDGTENKNYIWWTHKLKTSPITQFLEYDLLLDLLKEHFDVFGLIEKGLAISYNDLK